MYAPRGFYWTGELGDIEMIARGDELHLFHLTLPTHDMVAHCVSDDGLAWKPVAPAIRTGDPGDADDDNIWTMSVIERRGRYYMLYTALSSAEGGRVQRTNLAISDDLMLWEKSGANPVAEADPRWYEAEITDRHHMISWRDPKTVFEGDTCYAAICGRTKDGPFLRRGAVALISSTDMLHWRAEAPLIAPRRFYDMECPQLFKIGRYYYITAGMMEDHLQRYWVAENLRGPWRVIGEGQLAPRGHYAGRVVTYRGEDLYVCWHDMPCDGPGFGREDLRWSRGAPVRFTPAPLELVQHDDGRLTLAAFSGWEKYRKETPVSLSADGATALNGLADAEIATGSYDVTAVGGMEILASAKRFDHFILEGTLSLRAASGGLAFALEDDATGYFVWFYPEEGRVDLIRWLLAPREDGSDWFDHTVLQSAHADLSTLANGADVRLLAVGGEIEVSVNGRLLLAAISCARFGGRIGVFALSGRAALDAPTISSMRVPGIN